MWQAGYSFVGPAALRTGFVATCRCRPPSPPRWVPLPHRAAGVDCTTGPSLGGPSGITQPGHPPQLLTPSSPSRTHRYAHMRVNSIDAVRSSLCETPLAASVAGGCISHTVRGVYISASLLPWLPAVYKPTQAAPCSPSTRFCFVRTASHTHISPRKHQLGSGLAFPDFIIAFLDFINAVPFIDY
ncbi:hypothetical protein EV121DRAFT_255639 [Schizophyllum commune]